MHGSEALRAIESRTLQSADVLNAVHVTDSLESYGDIAYELGTVSGPIRPRGRPEAYVIFHYMAIWQLQPDRSWRIRYLAGQSE